MLFVKPTIGATPVEFIKKVPSPIAARSWVESGRDPMKIILVVSIKISRVLLMEMGIKPKIRSEKMEE